MRVENSKGECNFGQHEINFRYDEALATADDHALYKTGAKEIAAQEGYAITFIAKLDEREGNSCHIHCSLQNEDGGSVFADDETTFHRFVAGQLACLRELTLFFAPQVNSYKRFVEGSFAPDRGRLGPRQPHLLDARRGARPGPARGEPAARGRREPLPGARRDDRGRAARHRQRAPLEAPLEGNAYEADKERVPAHDVRGARPVRRVARWRATRSARRWSTTT